MKKLIIQLSLVFLFALSVSDVSATENACADWALAVADYVSYWLDDDVGAWTSAFDNAYDYCINQ